MKYDHPLSFGIDVDRFDVWCTRVGWAWVGFVLGLALAGAYVGGGGA